MSASKPTASNGNCDKEPIKPKRTVTVFPDIENAEAPIQLSRETTHSNHHVYIAPDNLTLRGTKGYCQAKGNNGVTEGRWFYEVELTKMGPKDNARIGWSMISSLLTGPCGFDLFSYSYRARSGMLYHDSRPRSPATVDALDTFIKGYGPGDVLGVEIHLPKPTEEQRIVLESRVWRPKARSTYEAFKVPLPLPKAGPQSEIRYYVNGQLLGTAFSDLYLGKYHPAFSLFRDAEAKVNFGPKFKFPPPHLVTEAEFPLIPIPKLVATLTGPASSTTDASTGASGSIPSKEDAPAAVSAIPPTKVTIAPHPASFSSGSHPSTTASSNPLASTSAANPPSTPSRAPPPPPLTLLPEPDRPESASQRQQAWDLMHAQCRVFPYYRVRDITPGKHYVDKSGSRVSKIQVTSPTSPFRSAAATKSARSDGLQSPTAGAMESVGPMGAAKLDTPTGLADGGHPLSPLSPIGSSKRRRTMGGGLMASAGSGMLSPTLGGVPASNVAHVPETALMDSLALPVTLVQGGLGLLQARDRLVGDQAVNEDVDIPDIDASGGASDGQGKDDGSGFRDSPLA